VVTGNTLLISHTDLQRNCLSRVTRLWIHMWLILSTSIYKCEIHNYFYNDKNIVSIKWKFFGYSVFHRNWRNLSSVGDMLRFVWCRHGRGSQTPSIYTSWFELVEQMLRQQTNVRRGNYHSTSV